MKAESLGSNSKTRWLSLATAYFFSLCPALALVLLSVAFKGFATQILRESGSNRRLNLQLLLGHPPGKGLNEDVYVWGSKTPVKAATTVQNVVLKIKGWPDYREIIAGRIDMEKLSALAK